MCQHMEFSRLAILTTRISQSLYENLVSSVNDYFETVFPNLSLSTAFSTTVENENTSFKIFLTSKEQISI